MGYRPDSSDYANESERNHKIGFKELTAVKLSKQQIKCSDALVKHNIMSVGSNLNNKIELQFDDATIGKVIDFSPVLPLVFKW